MRPRAWPPPGTRAQTARCGTLAVSGSTVYAGGDFTSIGGQTRNRIAALDAATGLATAWDPDADNRVLALAVSGSTVYAGGQFTRIGGKPRNWYRGARCHNGPGGVTGDALPHGSRSWGMIEGKQLKFQGRDMSSKLILRLLAAIALAGIAACDSGATGMHQWGSGLHL